MATQTDQDKSNQDFADAFNADSAAAAPPSDDEAFGLNKTDDQSGAAAAAAPADAAAAPAQPNAEDAAAAKAKELDDREAALKEREQELDARAASIQTSNANEVQTSTPRDEGEGKGAGGGEGGTVDDTAAPAPTSARAALAEDFGPEFVALLVDLIKEVASGSVTEQIGSLQSTVQSVIDSLQEERNVAHFKTIKAAHEDFMEIIDSPEFKSWVAALPEAEKADTDKVCESGTSQEIIHMLTQFKESKQAAGATDGGSALDDAEGVRSGGLRLPVEPTASQDYANAWNAA